MQSDTKSTETGAPAGAPPDEAMYDSAHRMSVDRRQLNREAAAAGYRPTFDERRRGPLSVQEWLTISRVRFLASISLTARYTT
jgi:hypothetical protein